MDLPFGSRPAHLPAPVVVADTPRDVLRALRASLDGAGGPLVLGDNSGGVGVGSGGGAVPRSAPPGTAAIVTTSGSTGHPKSVVLSRSALIAGATATAARIGEGRWLLALSPAYVAGLQVLVRGLLAGHEPAVVSGSFSPSAFAAVAGSMHSSVGGARVPTYTSLVPAQLSQLVEAADADAAVAAALRGFEAILVGGQALPDALRQRAEDLGARLVRTYGSSETSGGCVYDGIALPGVSLRVDSSAGVPAPDTSSPAGGGDGQGEVLISGAMLADGYLDDPERTAAVFERDRAGVRWYRTGDIGRVRDDELQITGRIDNVIVSGGVNISLDRVERAAREGDGLSGAVVVPVRDERWGAASVLVLTRDALAGRPAEAVLAEVRETVAERVGKPARPARVVVVDEMPTLAGGKPDRRALRELAGEAGEAGAADA